MWEPIGFRSVFPFLFGGTFIEGFGVLTNEQAGVISLSFSSVPHSGVTVW